MLSPGQILIDKMEAYESVPKKPWQHLVEPVEKGGPGSGPQGGEPFHGNRFTGGISEGGGEQLSEMAQRAKASHKPATVESQRMAEANEVVLAKTVGGVSTPDNEPFDVVVGKHFIEVKTIVSGKNDKITMHPESLDRKVKAAKKEKGVAHTVVFDARNNVVYYKKGVGSFRLKNMEVVKLAQLKGVFK